MKIHLHIDRIVIDRLPGGGISEAGLRRAVINDLTTRLSSGSLPGALHPGTSVAEVAEQDPPAADRAGSDDFGRQIGLAVFRGIRI